MRGAPSSRTLVAPAAPSSEVAAFAAPPAYLAAAAASPDLQEACSSGLHQLRIAEQPWTVFPFLRHLVSCAPVHWPFSHSFV